MGAASPDEVRGKHDRDYFMEDRMLDAESNEKKIIETGKPVVRKLEEIRWKDEHVTWSVSSKYPWYHSDGTIRGTFGVSSDVTRLMDTQEKLEQVAYVLGRQNEAMEEQLNLAREIQQAAFPSEISPVRYGGAEVRFYHRYQPASKLAGDFFEVFPLGEGLAGFFVCDVMGHGVRSALIVSMLRGLTEKQRQTVGKEPGVFLTGLNDGLCHLLERTSQMIFATAIYGVVDLAGGEVRLSVAGHPDPLVRRAGKTDFLVLNEDEKGPGLGVVPEFSFEEISIPLSGLEGIWAFTDGVFEVLGEDGEEFGPERLRDAMQAAELGAEAIEKAVKVACDYSAADAFDDDLCLLGVEFSGSA